MKKVLITGAGGFIGNQIYKRFLRDGYNTVGWDVVVPDKASDIIKIDMMNEDDVKSSLETCRPDIIIHCAGAADVNKSVQNPDADYSGNVSLTHNLLFGLHKTGLDKVRFVFLSTAGVYGNPAHLPISEVMPLNPMSPYALHKAMCETMCNYFSSNYEMDIKIARIFSAYGAGLRKQIFWDMYSKLKKTGELKMYGTGSESRDYIHVQDIVNALFLIATKEFDEKIINVANGEEVTIREAVECFAKCIGVSADKISFNGVVREGDPLNWRADIRLLNKLGYEKTVIMRKGIKEYIDWVQNQ